MKMKLIGTLLVGGMCSGLVSTQAMAASNIMYEYATVVDAEPIVKTVRVTTPREECWEENVVYRGSYDHGRNNGGNNAVGTVLGGVVGGAIGNAVGHKKSNKQVGAVVGAVLGATLGSAISQNAHANRRDDRNDRDDRDEYGVEEVCRVVNDYHEEERIMGYNVRYRYNNETFSTRMNRDPGDTIKIRLAVSPVI